jgi:hypothetical protein
MVLRVKVPSSCEDLSPAKVERMLERHFGHIPSAARELGVPAPDLRRLTWAQPKLLERALEDLELMVLQAKSRVIEALYSDDPQRMQWASDKIMSSTMARNSPFATARRSGRHVVAAPRAEVTFRWRDSRDAIDEAMK